MSKLYNKHANKVALAILLIISVLFLVRQLEMLLLAATGQIDIYKYPTAGDALPYTLAPQTRDGVTMHVKHIKIFVEGNLPVQQSTKRIVILMALFSTVPLAICTVLGIIVLLYCIKGAGAKQKAGRVLLLACFIFLLAALLMKPVCARLLPNLSAIYAQNIIHVQYDSIQDLRALILGLLCYAAAYQLTSTPPDTPPQPQAPAAG